MPDFSTAVLTAEPLVLDSTRPTLLVVDDEEGPRMSLRIVFKDDYNILLADGGEAALEFIRTQPVDAAILDIRMAGMSGAEVLERIKEFDPSIEVIMLTAYETVETARQALRSCACDYLNKPFDISTIRSAVGKAMERRQLSREIKSNSTDLELLRTELEDRKGQEEIARNRGEIDAAVVHDLNNPLTSISGLLALIEQRVGKLDRIEGEDLAFLKDRLTRTIRQVHGCVQISRRYLSFLREKSAGQPPVWLNQTLTDLGEQLKSNADAQRNQLIIHMLGTDSVVAVNGVDLMQVLLNLIMNALQCMSDPHRVEVRGRRLEEPIDLAVFVDGPESRLINRDGFANAAPMVALTATDDAPGILPEVATKLFDTQLTTKPADKGTGLGLSIVHRLVKECRGAVHLATKPGEGTTFTVYLPAAAVPPADAPRP